MKIEWSANASSPIGAQWLEEIVGINAEKPVRGLVLATMVGPEAQPVSKRTRKPPNKNPLKILP